MSMQNDPSESSLLDEYPEFLAERWTSDFKHQFKITRHKSWATWKASKEYKNDELWYCSSLEEASRRYSWSAVPNDVAGLKEMLRKHLDSRNDHEVLATCKQILRWGAVYKEKSKNVRWLESLCSKGQLCEAIIRAVQLLQPQCLEALEEFNDESLLFDSGTTKIYAFADPTESIAIYDSRVGAALCLLARLFLLKNGVNVVPPVFQFGWLNKKGDETESRNPSKEPYRFHRIHYGTKAAHASKAETSRRINRLLADTSHIIGSDVELESLERALFMIGYDVSM